QNMKEKSSAYLQKAEKCASDLVFPFRDETGRVLQWALQKDSNWKTKYYLALIDWNQDRRNDAEALFRQCGDTPDYAPFYLARANFERDVQQSIYDCRQAIQRDKSNWRAWVMLSDFYNKAGDKQDALKAIRTIFQKHPQDYRLGLPYAKALYNSQKYGDCLSVMDKLNVLPFEGASESHTIYRNAHLMAALQGIEKKKWKQALAHVENARQWPERLGVGRPYDVDERLEDYIEMIAREKMGQKEKIEKLLAEIVSQTQQYQANPGPNNLISALALRKQGRKDQAMSLLRKWEKASPEDTLAKWAIAKFSGQDEQALQMMKSLENAPKLRPLIKIAGMEK
ncbi:MAG: hypothetical protein GWP06_16355, partial [Actinobacteria bacterium]|nr:hypothetical protein [Actinomycetota bacterium]